MKESVFSFLSSDGKTRLHARLWEPERQPVGIIQVAHGITEHMGRYHEFAEYFTDRGYVVAGHDQLGHGASLDPENPMPMYFGPRGSWEYVVEDIRLCGERVKGFYSDLPLCLLGFSLGSFAVRCLLGKYPDLADKTVWAGTGQTKGVEAVFAGAIAALEERRFGDTGDTPLLHKLTMDTYNQKFKPCRTGADWLCANPQAVDEYLADPLCGEGFTVGSFRELLTGMKISASDAHVVKMNKAMPVLLLSGSQDPVGNFGKGLEAVAKQLKKHGFHDVEQTLFEGMRHDIFRETDRAQVYTRIAAWLEMRQ